MRAIVEVARLRSFSRAAETLGLTQPAVSAQVRMIEEEMGCRLFDRLGRNVYVTQPGALLLEYAKRMIELRRQAVEAVSEIRRPSARLTIGATESICLYVLPPVLKEYLAKNPTVAISIFRHNTDRVVRKLLEGVLDVGFISLPTSHPDLKVETVMRDRWVAALPWSHPLAARDSLVLEDLVDSPFILPEAGHTRAELDRMLLPYRKRVRIVFEASGAELIKRLVASGMGVTIIGGSYAKEEAAAGKLKIVALRGVEYVHEIGVAVRKDEQLSDVAIGLIAVAKQITGTVARARRTASPGKSKPRKSR